MSRRVMRMGMWSEFRLTEVYQETEDRRWAEMSDTSGEVSGWVLGRRVDSLLLRAIKEEESIAVAIDLPRASVREEYQLS